MLYFILNLAFLLVLGLLGLMGTGGLPGGNKDANQAAEQVAAKLAPFAGIIGVVSLVWGIFSLINLLSVLGPLLSFQPIWAIIWLVAVVVLIGLGLILSYPLLAKALAGAGGGQASLDKALATVKPYQRPLSLAAIGIAALYLLLYILAQVGVVL